MKKIVAKVGKVAIANAPKHLPDILYINNSFYMSQNLVDVMIKTRFNAGIMVGFGLAIGVVGGIVLAKKIFKKGRMKYK